MIFITLGVNNHQVRYYESNAEGECFLCKGQTKGRLESIADAPEQRAVCCRHCAVDNTWRMAEKENGEAYEYHVTPELKEVLDNRTRLALAEVS